MYQIIYTEHSLLDLRSFELKVSRRIVKKIKFFSLQKNLLKFAKKLNNASIGEYRFRIGEYRALFDIDKKGNVQILMILRIKHRKDIYNL